MGFEYKIKATLTQTHIDKIENLLQKTDYFERKYWVEDKLFYDFRHPDNVGKMPNASLVIENDGIYICQWSVSPVWTYLNELKNYLDTQHIAIQIIDYQE